MRFFDSTRSLPRSRLARFSQIDYDREMALVAIERGNDGAEHALGEVRGVADPGSKFADFAIVVASEIKGRGLGQLLLQSLISYCRGRGIGELRGETLGPLRQNSCRLSMMLILGAIRMRDGSVRRSIQEQNGGEVAAAGERQNWRSVTGDWGFGADIGTMA